MFSKLINPAAMVTHIGGINAVPEKGAESAKHPG